MGRDCAVLAAVVKHILPVCGESLTRLPSPLSSCDPFPQHGVDRLCVPRSCLQHDASDEANSSSDAASDAPEQSPPADAAVQQLDDPTLTATATAARGNDDPSLGADVDVDFSSHPGLGYRPGLGFRNRAAATRFTAVGLDDALEGMLGQDMPAGAGQMRGVWC